jgi:hypothetical protein
MRWCARCGASIDDGLILCSLCVSRQHLQQSVTIELTSPPMVILDHDRRMIEEIPGSGKMTVKAYDMSTGSKKRSPLRAVEKVQMNHDRNRYERAVWLYDRNDNLYCETWFDLDTGGITWGPKMGPLDDQSIHGTSLSGWPLTLRARLTFKCLCDAEPVCRPGLVLVCSRARRMSRVCRLTCY